MPTTYANPLFSSGEKPVTSTKLNNAFQEIADSIADIETIIDPVSGEINGVVVPRTDTLNDLLALDGLEGELSYPSIDADHCIVQHTGVAGHARRYLSEYFVAPAIVASYTDADANVKTNDDFTLIDTYANLFPADTLDLSSYTTPKNYIQIDTTVPAATNAIISNLAINKSIGSGLTASSVQYYPFQILTITVTAMGAGSDITLTFDLGGFVITAAGTYIFAVVNVDNLGQPYTYHLKTI